LAPAENSQLRVA